MTDTAQTRIRDLPMFEKRTPGTSDHDHIEAQRARGDMARDSIGMVHCFTQDLLFRLLDDDITRQVETEGVILRGIGEGPMMEFHANSVLFSNGEAHRTRRTPLARTFAFPVVRALRPEIRAAADALLEEVAQATTQGRVDILEQVAGPFPARVIARILGVPETDVPRFSALVYSGIRILQNRPREVLDAAQADLAELNAYVAGLMAERRRDPQDDFLSRFVKDADAAGVLDDTEIRIQITSLIFAGSDTTRAALTMLLARLLEHPGQWRMLCDDPETWKAPAVEEGLRFDPVVGGLGRVATGDFDLDGVRIVRGTVFSPSLLGAMRDPAVYADPFRFDIARQDHPRYTPAFGGGPHRCLGEALARVELEEAITALAARWPGMTIDTMPDLRGLSGTRTISPLVVAI